MFKLSTRARYAIQAMIELSLHEATKPLMLREIARAQDLSPKYLEQLAIQLRRAGLVTAARGARGGYELARSAEAITAREMVEAVEGPLYLVDCLHIPSSCDRTVMCAARRVWGRVSATIQQELSKTTLADLCEQYRAAQTGDKASYQI